MIPAALMLTGQESRVTDLPGLVRDLPPPVRVPVSRRETWRVRALPDVQRKEEPYEGDIVVGSGGHRVRLRPTRDYEFVEVEHRGTDRSYVVSRWTNGTFAPGVRTIWYRGGETPVSPVGFYRDRHNYAGSSYIQSAITDPDHYETPYRAYVVQSGRRRELGWGRLLRWDPDGLFVLEVAVDKQGGLLPTNQVDGVATRLVGWGVDIAVRGYWFRGRERDGTVVLASRPDDELAHSDGGTGPNLRVLRWRKGRFLGHWELPPLWRAGYVAPDGSLPLRPWLPVPPRDPSVPYSAPAESEREGAARRRSALDWTVGILRNGRLTVASLPKPPGFGGATADGFGLRGAGEVRFAAYRENRPTSLLARPQ